jgi:predicted RNase H-like nuclease (RuvC/YqgF family)
MVDNDPNKTNEQTADQGYEFQKETTQEFGNASASGGTEDLMSILRNKNVMYTLGGIVGLYVLLNLFSSGSEIEPVEAEEVQQEVAEPPTMQEQSASYTSFDTMLKETTEKDEDLEKLQRQVSSLNRQNTDLRSRVQTLDQKIDDINISLKRTSAQLEKLIDKDMAKSQDKKEVVLEEYRIKAVISGRAWLVDRSGNNTTVKVGDKLPTYGRVTEIKPVEGIVNTSSGRVIGFDAS